MTTAARRSAPAFALTSPDKVLYPELGLTKADLADYYVAVADRILPHVADRPLTLVRCPDGLAKKCFFQKHPPARMPAAIHTIELREAKGAGTYLWIDDVEGLLGLVQIGALELHVWPSHRGDVEHPDRLVLDLDPGPGVGWDDVVAAAQDVRRRLASFGVDSRPLVTGGNGVHVVAELAPRHDFAAVKAFAGAIAASMERDEPDRYVAEASKALRKGKVFVDWLRNARGSTAVCPWSTRARPQATVATPRSWADLAAGERALDVHAAAKRPSRAADPWRGLEPQRLPAAGGGRR